MTITTINNSVMNQNQNQNHNQNQNQNQNSWYFCGIETVAYCFQMCCVRSKMLYRQCFDTVLGDNSYVETKDKCTSPINPILEEEYEFV